MLLTVTHNNSTNKGANAMKEKLLNIKGELKFGDNKQNSKNCITKP